MNHSVLPIVFGCPACGYISKSAGEIKIHLIEKTYDKHHQYYIGEHLNSIEHIRFDG